MAGLYATFVTSFCASLIVLASCAAPLDGDKPGGSVIEPTNAQGSQALLGIGGGWEGTNCSSPRPVGCTCTNADECTVLGWFCNSDGDRLRCTGDGKCTCINDKYICLFGCGAWKGFGGF
jgi:hypothetical protein